MNNIMEYQRIISKNTKSQIPTITNNNNLTFSRQISSNELSNNILEELNNEESNTDEDNHEIYSMCNGIKNEYTKSEIVDNLFIKLHRLEHIDANGCIMIKPPRLRRSNNTQFNVITLEEKFAKFEENITVLEKSLNDVERLSLYENRLNKLHDFIVCKNEKYLYNEN